MFFDNKKQKEIESKKWLSVLSTTVLSLILIFLSSIGWLETFKKGVSYVLDPIYNSSATVAVEIKEFFTTVTNISSFREEYNQMKLDIAQYEIDNLVYQKLQNENDDLRTQLELGNKEHVHIQSEVLDHIETDYMIVNVGLQDRVSKGDIATLGDSYIGIVIETGQSSSKIRLPISKSSFLEAYVLSSEEESEQRILSRAVVSGSSDGIRIENIGMNSGVQNGDIVIVNDSKVGENLVLGTVVGLSEDPATTTRTGYVSPIVDYYDLANLFIRIDDAS
jgi:rod shape-determining protein MreC